MFSFLRRELPAAGRVMYAGSIPPSLALLSALPNVTVTPGTPSADQVWIADVSHPSGGPAEIACLRQPLHLPVELIDHALSLADDEKAQARRGEATLTVRVRAQQKQVLKDRKRLLFWLRALMQADGAVAFDDSSTLLWSLAMLEDELQHDADLDIESLYALHAVQRAGESAGVAWLHTHGLEELGAFDVDVLHPSPTFVANCGDPMRALAFAALEGAIAPDTDRFQLAYPDGEVRLVAVSRYHAEAAPEHQRLRDLDTAHSGRRAVVCEPVRGLLRAWRSRPAPARFLSEVQTDGFVVPFSAAATELMAERARQTLAVFRNLKEEFASLALPTLVKLGYETEGGAPDDREHLWFAVHQIHGDTVDATLVNAPHRVPSLKADQRGQFELARLTDWVILSPEGQMSSRNVGAARRLRATREAWQARIDAATRQG